MENTSGGFMRLPQCRLCTVVGLGSAAVAAVGLLPVLRFGYRTISE